MTSSPRPQTPHVRVHLIFVASSTTLSTFPKTIHTRSHSHPYPPPPQVLQICVPTARSSAQTTSTNYQSPLPFRGSLEIIGRAIETLPLLSLLQKSSSRDVGEVSAMKIESLIPFVNTTKPSTLYKAARHSATAMDNESKASIGVQN